MALGFDSPQLATAGHAGRAISINPLTAVTPHESYHTNSNINPRGNDER
jgi:hypothetical protein